MIFDGADEEVDGLGPAKAVCAGILVAGASLLMGAIILAFSFTNARAQAGQPSNCSGTATSTAAAIVYPTSGETGPTSPSQFVTISNPSGSATLWVCAVKGCAATANGAGSMALAPVGSIGLNGVSWSRLLGYQPPLTISILSSAATSPFTCWYQ